MNRSELISAAQAGAPWDALIIGGGATGLGVAVEAASRGYRTLLLEQADLCKGTSSKSTKLIHGGVRYLEQGNVRLVVDALRERGRLLRNAPHLVKPLPMIIPIYRWWEKTYYGAGLGLYDLLAGKLRVGRSKWLSREDTLRQLPTLGATGLRGGVLFWDAQFDDTRLGIALARTFADRGGILINYFQVTALLKSGKRINGVLASDEFSGTQHEIEARVVINCTGVFSDQVREMDGDRNALIAASRGSHVVLDRSFLRSDTALLIPRTTDGRVLFAIPWHDRVVAGTTEVPVSQPELEPRPTQDEIDFIISHLGHYLETKPASSDILSVFAGLRPLVKADGSGRTSSLSRDHVQIVSESGLVSVIGGKWTTYRKMGEDAVNQAVQVANLPPGQSITPDLCLESGSWEEDPAGTSKSLSRLIDDNPVLAGPLHANTFYCLAEVVRAVREEWACTVEDVLARRTRLLLLDAKASIEAAPAVAALMAAELGHDEKWQENQVTDFQTLALRYLP